jgi:hypothetical protein
MMIKITPTPTFLMPNNKRVTITITTTSTYYDKITVTTTITTTSASAAITTLTTQLCKYIGRYIVTNIAYMYVATSESI